MRIKTPAIVTTGQFEHLLQSLANRAAGDSAKPDLQRILEGNTFKSALLSDLLPFNREIFFQKYFDKNIYYHRSSIDFSKHFPSRNLWQVLNRAKLRDAYTEFFRKLEPLRRPNQRERLRLFRSLHEGNGQVSFRIIKFHHYDPFSFRLLQAFQNFLGNRVSVNCYYTPKDSQTLPCHFDCHPVFIIQIYGSKLWKLYRPGPQKPLYGEGSPVSPKSRSHISSFLLQPGDLLFIPRGFLHEAESVGSPSFHLTFGVFPLQTIDFFSDLVERTLSDECKNEPTFRNLIHSPESLSEAKIRTIKIDFLRSLEHKIANDTENNRLHFFRKMPKLNLPDKRARRMSSQKAMQATFIRSALPCLIETFKNLGIFTIEAGNEKIVLPLKDLRVIERILRNREKFSMQAPGIDRKNKSHFSRVLALLYQKSLIELV
jgi:hypothetical protein